MASKRKKNKNYNFHHEPQSSIKASDVNSLLAFQYKDDADDVKNTKPQRRKHHHHTPFFTKEQYMQAGF